MNENDQLRRLLGEVLNELARQFHAETDDDEDYLESLFERARALGVNA